ncbi:phosphotransferase family protein [Kineococcus gynurae]|uniref:Phosphotransferase family protein n=1 Tax=Kineococcus gynurae TaxID=452979 RepID=A0ABV5LTD9_9ACTN
MPNATRTGGALDWVRSQVRLRGAPRLHKHRPWSRVWEVPTSEGVRWLKACSPATAHEARLLPALAAWGVPGVPRPLAAEPDAGYLLLADHGATLNSTRDASRRWPQVLGGYAAVQRRVTPHAAELLALGVPDLRLGVLPDVAADLFSRWAPGLAGEVARIRDEAAELAELGPPPTLQHDDLHDGNVFAADLAVFDWGDACVGHPFSSLLVALQVDDAVHPSPAARTAYLAGWDLAPTRHERAVELGVRLGRISRAHSWERALADWPDPPAAYAGAPGHWLRTLQTTV